jgi:homopolymeric O-antigen transport system permease protein
MSRDTRRLPAKLFLLKEMVVRDIRARYAGSGLGLLWAVLHPILWMLLYTAVFSVVLRVPVERGFATFPEFLMAALLPWMAIHEGISRSAAALIDNAAVVKKAVFPVETLVLAVVVAAIVNQLVAFLVFGVYVFFLGHLSPWILLAIPALVLQALLTYGIGCFAATITAFVRDAGQAIGILLTVLFFATPIVYPASLVPERFRPLLEANPIAHLAAWYRTAFTLHTLPDVGSVLYLSVFSLAAATLGGLLFHRARPHFADLI